MTEAKARERAAEDAATDALVALLAPLFKWGFILLLVLIGIGGIIYVCGLGWDYYQEKVVAQAEKKAKAEERMTAMIVENDQAAVKEIAALKAARAKVLADRAKREAEEAERRRQEELRLKKEAADAEKMAQEEERKSAMLKDMKAFAVKEAPKLWETTVKLRAEIESTEKRLAEMRKTLETAKKDPESDATYLKLLRTRNFAIRSTRIIDAKLEAAFIAAQKFAAAPGKQELSEMKRKALEDGANEADAVAARFGTMQAVKEEK